jgi:hypothetical protein
MTAVLGFYGVQAPAFEAWTLASGRPRQVSAHLDQYSSAGRYNCAGFDLREAPLMMNRVVCASYRYDEAPPPGTPVTLFGEISPLGIHVTSFEIQKPAPTAPTG